MLIPKDLTVRELKEECENVKSICKDCKYNGACNGFGDYALKIDSEYPNFTKQEIDIIKFYNNRGYKRIWVFENRNSIVFDDGGSSIEIPMFLMPHFLKENNFYHKFDIEKYFY